MKRLLLFLALGFIGIAKMMAGEGMWLPMLIERLNYADMQKEGLRLTAEEIYSINNSSLKDAIVMINDGDCTGFMVSENGMMMTNHHCALDYLQANADDENDYIKQGFWAGSKFEELRTEHLAVSFLVRVENKTSEILSQLSPMMTEAERKDKIAQTIMRIEGREEEDSPDLDARIASFYNGNEFYMFVYETYSDVRIVGIPPESVGVFGADSDNWSWPRHTGDFAFLRVYMSPEGKPATYNLRNVPYRPKKHLPISLKGVQKDDFAMILGYPGSTDRFITSYGVKNIEEKLAPSVVAIRDKKMAVLKQDMQKDEKVQMKYISKYNHTSNYWKYFKEQRNILIEMGVYREKKQQETAFVDWVNEDKNRLAKYAEALPLIERAYKEIDRLTISRYYYNEIVRRGVDVFSLIRSFNALKAELSMRVLDKEAVERKALGLRYTSGNFYKSYRMETDRELFAVLMEMYYHDVPKEQQPDFFLSMVEKYRADFTAMAAEVYEKSMFSNKETLSDYLRKPSLKKLKKDILFQLTVAFNNKYQLLKREYFEAKAILEKGNRIYLEGLLEMHQGEKIYPDANSTMRLTYGKVLDYNDKNGQHFDHYTTIDQQIKRFVAKDPEFHLTDRYLQQVKLRDFGPYGVNNTLPLCFITTNDVTGGNSGAPVINADGELIGLVFDVNREGCVSPLAYNKELHRSICVDIRYVLWVVDKYAQADYVLKDLGMTSQ